MTTQQEAKTTARDVMRGLIADWQEARRVLRLLEEAEHPDLTDALGRTWRWLDGDLYRHDSMVWTKRMALSPRIGLPTQRALGNPNYAWCAICKGVTA